MSFSTIPPHILSEDTRQEWEKQRLAKEAQEADLQARAIANFKRLSERFNASADVSVDKKSQMLVFKALFNTPKNTGISFSERYKKSEAYADYMRSDSVGASTVNSSNVYDKAIVTVRFFGEQKIERLANLDV